MAEIPFSYYHTMSSQVILICTFLAGFSATILGSFVTQKSNKTISKLIILACLMATCLLLITVFFLTNIFIHTTDGYPGKVTRDSLQTQMTMSMIFFGLGVASFLVFVSLSGWLNSRRLGIVTTVMGIGTMIVILMILT